MNSAPQDFSNHRRWYPLFHFVVFPIIAMNLVLAAWRVYRSPTPGNVWVLATAFALAGLALAARMMALTVQDRLIILEQRLRMRAVLSPDLFQRIGGLSRRQFVGLRFAGDEELESLVEQCLAGTLTSADDVKKRVRHWQPDWIRA